jgi:hypothetical protein
MRQQLSKIFLTFLMLNGISYASDDINKMYGFVGIQASATEYDGISIPSIGIKYGQQTSSWRTAISYNYGEESNERFQSLIIQMDNGVLGDAFKKIPFKPYLGFSLGVVEHHNSNIGNDRGYLYGVNGGFNYVLNHTMDIDLGYRYMISSKLKDIDNNSNIMLSLHYYFE